MNFDECVAEIEAMSGGLVMVEFLGREPDQAFVADFWGVLSRVPEPDFSPEHAELLAQAEVAASFVIGDGRIALLPSRFLSAAPIEHRTAWLQIDTRDAIIRIGPKRPAWFD